MPCSCADKAARLRRQHADKTDADNATQASENLSVVALVIIILSAVLILVASVAFVVYSYRAGYRFGWNRTKSKK